MGILSFTYNAAKAALRGKGKVSPTIKSVKPFTEKKFGQFGFTKAKNPTERANIVRKRESIKRMDKVTDLRKKREEGIKASKEMKRMVQTGQAKIIGGAVFHKGIPEQKAKGGRVGLKRGTPFKKETNVEKIKKAFGSKKSLGMQSVIYGLDKNPDITKADPKAKFIAAANKKNKKKVI